MSTTIELSPISMGHTVATSGISAWDSQGPASAPRSSQDRTLNPTQAIDNVDVRYLRAVKRFQKCLSACWLKIKTLGHAIGRNCVLQNMDALGNLCACLSKCWTRLQKNLISIALPTWMAVIMTLIIGGASLRYAYMTIELAEWTAKKDFHELCQSLNVCR